MELDPLRIVRRTSPALHCLALVLLALAIPLAWMGLDLLRVAIDDAIGGAAFENAPYASFLRLQIDLPERIADEPLVLFRGFGVERLSFVVATLLGFLALSVLVALLVLVFREIGSAIEARSVTRLRRTILDRILAARSSGREEAREAAALAGDGVASVSSILGGAILRPVAAAGAILVGLLYALSVDWKLAIVVADALVLAALLWPRGLAAEREARTARRSWGGDVRDALDELVHRLPALRAHGTAAFEREQLTRELGRRQRPARNAQRWANLYSAAASFAIVGGPVLVLGLGAWLAPGSRLTAGQIVAVAVAAGLAIAGMAQFLRWHRDVGTARPFFEELSRTLGSLHAGSRAEQAVALPGAGRLVATNVTAHHPASGVDIAGLELSLTFPSHVAVIGDIGSGARLFAALVGGQIAPSTGTLTFGGAEIAKADAADRARRLAFAGGDTILFPGSLRRNLLYGCPEAGSSEIDHRLLEATAVAGLDHMIYARGLSGRVNPRQDGKLAAALVEARGAVRSALAAEHCEDLVEPFDPARYNRQATVGENILFGMPLGDTFREEHLPSHPFVRAILESQGLTKTLAAMGLSIAASTIEIFADIPDGHPLFERFSFITAAERGYFEDLLDRKDERRRPTDSADERERLISLALRYSESRHRFGLLGPEIEERLVAARAAFATLLPLSLKPAIEFYETGALCAAASLQDNLLFGRVNYERAGAEAQVRRIVRRVLAERGLDRDVMRIGLDSPLDPRAADLSPSEAAAVDVVRCLVRRPDVLIVERALDGSPETPAFVARLRRALIGRGLILVLPELTDAIDSPPFDAILRFDRGVATVIDRRRSPASRAVEASESVG